MAGTILYKLSLDATKFETGLKKAERQLQKTGANMQRLGKSLSTYVTAPLAGMATVAVMAFDKQAKAVAQVEQGLKSTGNAAGYTKDQLLKMASDLQKTTLFGDEEILKDATAQLLTFTNIAGEQFARTQKVALDLATRLDGDLKSATIMVAKAMNDPIANLSAMSRAGVQFSESQKIMIKQLAATGRMAEAQTIILDELERQYGGSAQAAVTGAGKITQLKNAVGDLAEQFGSIVLQYIDPLIDKIRNLTERLSNMSEGTKHSIVKWAAFAAALGPVIFVTGKIIALLAGVAKAIRVVNAAFMGNPIVLAITAIIAAIAGLAFVITSMKDSIYAFAGYFTATWDRIQIAFLEGKGFIMDIMANIINGLIDKVNGLTEKLGFGKIIKSSFDISGVIDENKTKIDELQAKIDSNPWNGIVDVWDAFKTAALTNIDKVKNIFSFGMDNIQEKAEETGAVLSGALGVGGGSGGGGRASVTTPAKMQSKGAGQVGGGFDAGAVGLANMEGFLQRQAEYIGRLTESWWDYFDVVGYVADTVPRITDAFGEMIAGTKGAFRALVSDMLMGLKRIINGLLAEAIAGMIAGESKKGLVGLLTASIGLGAITAMWNSKVPKLAKGAMEIPSGFPNDTYPAFLSSGEMVIPKPAPFNAAALGGGFPQRVELFASYDTLMAVINAGNKRANS